MPVILEPEHWDDHAKWRVPTLCRNLWDRIARAFVHRIFGADCIPEPRTTGLDEMPSDGRRKRVASAARDIGWIDDRLGASQKSTATNITQVISLCCIRTRSVIA